jgi:CRISPR-associated protein Cas5d
MRPIRFIALRRNEVKEKINVNAVKRGMAGGEVPPIVCDATKDSAGTDMAGRTQRQSMALRDVRYRIHAHIQPRQEWQGRARALEEQAARRISGGKCFYQPYLGCREFVAYFEPADGAAQAIPDSMNIGIMLYDVFDLDQVLVDDVPAYITAFKAHLDRGVMDVPPWESAEVLRPERRR